MHHREHRNIDVRWQAATPVLEDEKIFSPTKFTPRKIFGTFFYDPGLKIQKYLVREFSKTKRKEEQA